MKNKILTLLITLISLNGLAQWQPAGDKIKTEWSEKIDVKNIQDRSWNVPTGKI